MEWIKKGKAGRKNENGKWSLPTQGDGKEGVRHRETT
jgi:hypothetical protein